MALLICKPIEDAVHGLPELPGKHFVGFLEILRHLQKFVDAVVEVDRFAARVYHVRRARGFREIAFHRCCLSFHFQTDRRPKERRTS